MDNAIKQFETIFGRLPRFAAAAPGRINLMGDHVDYCGGFVLPMAIDRVTMALGSPRSDASIEVFSSFHQQRCLLERNRTNQTPVGMNWSAYIRGVVVLMEEAGIPVPGFCLLIDSNVPLGAGLSSSAALEVAVATFLEALTGQTLDPWFKARLCQRAEHAFAGVPCGLMDQMASVFGQAGHSLLFDCDREILVLHEFPADCVSVLALDTGVRHALGASEYPRRRADCERAAALLGLSSLRQATRELLDTNKYELGQTIFRRAIHVVSEMERTRLTAEALGKHDWSACHRLMAESHRSLRDDFEVSCAELDAVVEVASQIGLDGGVYGCRMTGGGFGGSCVALVDPARQDQIIQELERGYSRVTGRKLTAMVTQPGPGAHRVF